MPPIKIKKNIGKILFNMEDPPISIGMYTIDDTYIKENKIKSNLSFFTILTIRQL
tara:strand:+ start:906 stop:1070 length:165 start_codon:yes stop_codon:yes gene_type:complete